MPKRAPGPGTVRVFPMPVAPIDGVAHKVQDVDPATAERLTAPISRHTVGGPGVFVTDPALLPDGYMPPDPDGLLTPSAEGTATAAGDTGTSPVED